MWIRLFSPISFFYNFFPMIKRHTLRSIVASTAVAMVLMLQASPLALAKTASSAAANIDNLKSDVHDQRTGTVNDSDSHFNTTGLVQTYFNNLSTSVNDALTEIRSITLPLSPADFDIVDTAYTSFKSEVNRAVTTAQNHTSFSGSLTDAFNAEKTSLNDDLKRLRDAENKLQDNLTTTTSTTTGNTSSTVVQSVISSIDDATSNVKGYSTDASNVLRNSQKLSTLMDNITSEAEDVITALKRITGSISSVDLDDLTQAVKDFKKQADKQITTAGSGSISPSQFDTDFTDAKDTFKTDEKNTIDKQIDRISSLALGTGISGTSIINSAISSIESSQSDAEDLRKNTEPNVTTPVKLTSYMEDLTSYVTDVETKLKHITGTMTQTDFDDLSQAVSDFQKEVKKGRDTVQTDKSSLINSHSNDFDNLNTDFKDELKNMNNALSRVETLIGTANVPSSTNSNTSFYDVTSTSEFFTYITALAARNVVTGYADRSFHPKANVTRAEFLKMALIARGRDITAYLNTSSPFVDVSSAHALRPYINYAVANNIITGQTLNGSRYYYPERPISRAEATIILMRITGIAPGTATASRFMDVRDPEQVRYIEVAAAQGVLNGYSATVFGPNDFLTREQAAKIVARINGIAR